MSRADSSDGDWRRWRTRLFGLFGLALLIALGLIAWGVLGAERQPLALEAAKVGMQLAVVTLLGAALGFVLGRVEDARRERAKLVDVEREERRRHTDVQREERRRLNDYRLGVFREAIHAYNEVATVRRTLRALGFVPLPSGPVKPDQLEQFNEQMRRLNHAELSLELIEREIKAQHPVFPKAHERLDRLEKAERFLRDVLDVWEENALLAQAPDDGQKSALERLDAFLAKKSTGRADDLLDSMDIFDMALRKDLITPLPAVPTPRTAVSAPREERS